MVLFTDDRSDPWVRWFFDRRVLKQHDVSFCIFILLLEDTASTPQNLRGFFSRVAEAQMQRPRSYRGLDVEQAHLSTCAGRR
jgi:hypothetical protein